MGNASAFRSAVEARDFDALMAQFAEKAVLHSPVTFTPFEGRAAIRQLLTILLEVFQDFRYTDELDASRPELRQVHVITHRKQRERR